MSRVFDSKNYTRPPFPVMMGGQTWAVSSAVERLPYKQDATGSNPVPPMFPSLNPIAVYKLLPAPVNP